jgi:hypothetical protein
MLNIKEAVERLNSQVVKAEYSGILESSNCIFYALPLTLQVDPFKYNWKQVFSADKFSPVSGDQECIDLEFVTTQTEALEILKGFTDIVSNLAHDSELIQKKARILLSVQGISSQLSFISASNIKQAGDIKTMKYRKSLPMIDWEDVSIYIGGRWYSLASDKIREALVNLVCLLTYEPLKVDESKLILNSLIKQLSSTFFPTNLDL